MNGKYFLLICFLAVLPALWSVTHGEKIKKDDVNSEKTPDAHLKGESIPSKTDSEAVDREAEQINIDGLSVKEQQLLENSGEKHMFQAEVNSLMKIIINSLYSNTEIFLRELISNASDAIDKIRYLGLTDKEQLNSGAQFEIRIKADEDKKQIHICDTGIGMTKAETVKNLGTIAQSGTAAFLENYKNADGDTSMIGQFGVGFYSAFLVADRVTVTTKNNNDKQVIWQSDSKGSFSVVDDPRGTTLGRGTCVTMDLKEDAEEFLKQDKLEGIVKKYSQFINYPIFLWKSHTEKKSAPMNEHELKQQEQDFRKKKDEERKKKSQLDEEEEKVDIDGETKQEKSIEEEISELPTTKLVDKDVFDWEQMNQSKPIWTRPSKEITEAEYTDFYKTITKESEEPMHHIHFSAEGEVEFKSLLYIPKLAPSGMFDPNQPAVKGIKLYVRKVFITDEFTDILPKYLNFMRGIVDSDDLPLNVSREMLQEHKTLRIIKKKLVRKAIAMIQEMADNKKEDGDDEAPSEEEVENKEGKTQKFNEFWKQFGTNIKLGVIEDPNNRTRLSKLLRFQSNKTGDLTSLSDYVSRMKPEQNQIYYLAGETLDQLKVSPLIERLEKKGYEVLFMTDPIDEYCLANLEKYDGKYRVTNISREGLALDGEKVNEEREKEEREHFKILTEYFKKKLGDRIDHANPSKRLTTSPSALVSAGHGYTANMERIMRAQALAGNVQAPQAPKKTLEYNPRHPIIKELLRKVQDNPEDPSAADVAELLYDTAALRSGFILEDPSVFADKINNMLRNNMGISPDAPVDDYVEEAPAKEETKDGKDEL